MHVYDLPGTVVHVYNQSWMGGDRWVGTQAEEAGERSQVNQSSQSRELGK